MTAWWIAGRQLEEAAGDTWKCGHLEGSSQFGLSVRSIVNTLSFNKELHV